MKRKSSNYIKITSLFTKSIVMIFVIMFFVDMLIMIKVTEYRPTLTQDPAQFTSDMGKYIEISHNRAYINDNGKKILKDKNAWIQIVDNKLTEAYSYKKPKNVPKQYTPIEFVHVYKYDTVNSTLFIGEKNKFSYFIGFPIDKIAKYNVEYNPHNIKTIIGGGILAILAANLIIILIFGYIYFARKMGKPLEKVLIYIEELSNGNYKINEREKGIYKYVFKNLNVLSKVLMDNKNRKKKIDELRDQWISSIGHDMKTPLSSIKGFSEILKDNEYDFEKDEVREYAGIIYDKSLYMEELINDLNFSYKLRNNCVNIKKKKIYFSQWLKDIVYKLHSSPEFKDRNVNIDKINENLIVDIDELMMKRAFVNIITNFLMYNDNRSTIEVGVKIEEGFIKTTIKDNGKGIPEKDIEHIFERYYRGTNTTSNSKGSGLGMAIANDIVKLHEGFCDVKSKEGEGTELTIFLKYNN
ncbi:signal transduction histidine kinase [Clostridium acetobutylicum]|uniref:histidine kinase n=1 Tax=Clostridium acetobutylicum (strain ATCC 824 / DSM 792 / JCM 1419 / IAM 19013 / LMG 5710 / NBRC 13948 / NRRL B-527 / VKM B-1787 / 2291 / W) TaxID=272562 RepID=Q97MA8_CLOAB|nr:MULTISPECIES: HAMP domain-containing sensor histidine kinase [Clostridium]AAK78271.1 Sensory transduction histidine kinases [Clostridium acetobutylicum ATCC 824]AEI33741.1 sensory transduction histidine kinase [Clostridium acetobutylicum DSM 1731]AWV82121.1 sensor histidine kinase [Clostridium acetobutylicum]AWV82170.1 sensor histidine kinase [Clostridium acetobutylicum]MBC2396141.1 HAMP domain-containing histidine kinase [Clostridium acetobutylicum]